MIIVRSPMRISLAGGGTDIPTWLEAGHKGLTVGGAINKYSFIYCRDFPPYFGYKTRLSYSQTEEVQNHKEIQHKVIKAVLQYFNLDTGVELIHITDLFSKCGLGSSSTFLVSLINAVAVLQQKYLSAQQLAEACIHIEQALLKDSAGLQDGIFSAFGGFNILRFGKNHSFTVEKMNLTEVDLVHMESCLMLYYTGIARMSSEVTASYINLLPNKQSEQEQMLDLAEQAIEVIQSRNFTNLGRIMHKSWLIKRSLSDKVSNPEIDKLYQQALSYGALGGKLCGAGSGGCLLLCVEPGKKKEIRQKFSKLVEIPFKFSPTGAEIVLNKEM